MKSYIHKLTTFAQNLENFAINGVANFEEGLKAQEIPEEIKKKAISIFKQTLVPTAVKVATNLRQNLKKSHYALFSGLSAMGIVEILESIIDFRKK